MSSGTGFQPARVEDARNLAEAGDILLARSVDPACAEAMLREALRQLEVLAPFVSAEAWEGFIAVQRAADTSS